MMSAFIITTIIVLLVRKYGKKFVYEFGNKDTIDKMLNSKLLKNHKKIEFIMFLLFFIPGTPKDLLVYIGGLLPIKPARFIAISTLARIPSIVSSTIAGENLLYGNWQLAILLYGAIFLLVLIIVLIVDKNKTTQKLINEIKKES